MNMRVIPIQPRRFIDRNLKSILERRVPRLYRRLQHLIRMAARRNRQAMKMQIRRRQRHRRIQTRITPISLSHFHAHAHAQSATAFAAADGAAPPPSRNPSPSNNRHRRRPIQYGKLILQTQNQQIPRRHPQRRRRPPVPQNVTKPRTPIRLPMTPHHQLHPQHAVLGAQILRLLHHRPNPRPRTRLLRTAQRHTTPRHIFLRSAATPGSPHQRRIPPRPPSPAQSTPPPKPNSPKQKHQPQPAHHAPIASSRNSTPR